MATTQAVTAESLRNDIVSQRRVSQPIGPTYPLAKETPSQGPAPAAGEEGKIKTLAILASSAEHLLHRRRWGLRPLRAASTRLHPSPTAPR